MIYFYESCNIANTLLLNDQVNTFNISTYVGSDNPRALM